MKWIARMAVFWLVMGYCVSLSADSGETAPETWVVGFAQDTMSNDWRIAQVRELEREFEKYPSVRFFHTDAKMRRDRRPGRLKISRTWSTGKWICAAISKQMEQLAKAGKTDRMDSLLSEFESEFAKVGEHMRRYI